MIITIESVSKMLTKCSSNYDYLLKLIIIGDSGVGKTNILTTFSQSSFRHSHEPTIGLDFNIKTMEVNSNRYRLQIWDTAGQERFKTITETYYKGSSAVLIVFAVDNRDSFESIGTLRVT